MPKKYMIHPHAYIEKTKEGLVAIDPSQEKIIFLGENEQQILDIVLNSNEEELISKVLQSYDGENIIEDIQTFLSQLLDLKILIPNESDSAPSLLEPNANGE